jgi:hypothetical protein
VFIGDGDINEEWRRIVIDEWRRYEACIKPGATRNYYGWGYGHDWATLKRVMESRYCVDRLALAVIDKEFTKQKWSEWMVQPNTYEGPQSLLAAAVPHGLSVIDALINVGARYDVALFRSIIVHGEVNIYHQLMERSDAEAIIPSLSTIKVDQILPSMAPAWQRSPKQVKAMLRLIIDELKLTSDGGK